MGIFINDGVNISFKDNFVFGIYIGLFRYVTEDSSLVLDSVIENNTLADVQSFDTTGLVLQDSVWNCGPATLVNLFKLYGLDVSQEEISSIAGTDSDGTSLYGLYLACVHYGFNVSAWYLDSIEGIRVNDLVVLLLDGEYHFTLIKGVNETSVLLADSSFGILDLDLDVFEDLFSGYVLDLNSTSERGQRLNVELMGNITGTWFFIPLVLASSDAIIAGLAGIGIGISVGVIIKYGSNVKSYVSSGYNYVKRGITSIYKSLTSSKFKPKPSVGDNINNILKSYTPGSGKVSYSPSTGKYYIKGYGSYSASSLISKGVSSKLLGEVAYKAAYDIYLKSKNKERNKLKDYNKEEREFHNRILKEYLKGTYKSLNVPDGGNGTDILKCLYEDAINNYKYGQKLIKSGDIQKGSFYLAFSFWEVSFIPSVVYVQLTSSL
ncbi:MAG: cysteine peptidase family C39 domain-containing protein [Methanobacteriaceae archaeon]|nr:cysteine peptidase family C39 domain-containing protein [Methanobacteriaceae archaeon]